VYIAALSDMMMQKGQWKEVIDQRSDIVRVDCDETGD
jgi:hypothetical protein